MINEGEFIQKSATSPIEDELSIQELGSVSKSKEIPPEKPEKEDVETHDKELKLSRFDEKFVELASTPEVKTGVALFGLFMWEVMRDLAHYDADYSSAVGFGRNVPIKTEGMSGFIDLHIGSVAETIMVIYASRIVIELISKATETWADKKISANLKAGTSIFLGALLPSLIELSIIDMPGNHVADPLDLFGPLVGAAYAGLAWKFFTSEKGKNIKQEFISAVNETDSLKLMFAGLWASVGGEVIDQLFAIAKEEVKTKVELFSKPTGVNKNPS